MLVYGIVGRPTRIDNPEKHEQLYFRSLPSSFNCVSIPAQCTRHGWAVDLADANNSTQARGPTPDRKTPRILRSRGGSHSNTWTLQRLNTLGMWHRHGNGHRQELYDLAANISEMFKTLPGDANIHLSPAPSNTIRLNTCSEY